MDLGAVKIRLDQLLAALANGRVVEVGAGIEANVSGPLEEMKIAECFALAGDASDVFEIGANRPGSDRQRERIDDAHPRLRRVLGQFGARPLDGLPYGDGPQSDFGRSDHGAGHGEHERRSVAEIAVELNRPCAPRQVELIQLQVHVGELLLLVLHVVIELDVNDRQAGEAEGANAEIRRAGRLQGGVQSDGLLDGARNQLLDLLGGSSRPLALGGGHADRDIRVLALGHVVIAKPAPNEGREQQNERHLPVLGEEPGHVVRGRYVLGVALEGVGHRCLFWASQESGKIKSHRGAKSPLGRSLWRWSTTQKARREISHRLCGGDVDAADLWSHFRNHCQTRPASLIDGRVNTTTPSAGSRCELTGFRVSLVSSCARSPHKSRLLPAPPSCSRTSGR